MVNDEVVKHATGKQNAAFLELFRAFREVLRIADGSDAVVGRPNALAISIRLSSLEKLQYIGCVSHKNMPRQQLTCQLLLKAVPVKRNSILP